MKKIITHSKWSLVFFVIAIQLLVVSCNSPQNQDSTSTKLAIPALLQRNDRLQIGNEWQQVQNNYASFKQEIEKSNAALPKLMLSELFVKEARVTGEHGHYYPAALVMVDNVIEDKKSSNELLLQAMILKSGVQLSLHNFAEAQKTAVEALKLNPSNAQLLGVMVDANVELGKYDDAVQFADKMVSIRPDLRSYARIAYLREIFGDVDGSKAAMMMAVKAGYPGLEETSWAMHTMGEMLIRYGEADKAIDVFQTILEQRKDYPFAVAGLGQAYEILGDDQKAEEYYKTAIDILPEVGFNISLAKLYKRQGKIAESKKLANEVLEMLADDEKSGHVMDLAYADVYLFLLDDSKKALLYAQKEYTERPENIEVNKVMATIYLHDKDINQLKYHAEIASKTACKDPEILELKAKSLSEVL